MTLRRGDWWKFEAAQLRKPIEASQRDSKSQRARIRLSWERGDTCEPGARVGVPGYVETQ